MGKIYPVLPKDELDRFAAEVLTEEALAELLSDPERYVFAYVADIERSGRSGKFQSFNMYESANVIRATYGKLDVTIEFKEDRNGMQKLVTYADERLLSRYAQCDPTRWRKGEVDNSLSQYLSIDELWSRTKRNYQRNVAVVKPALSLDCVGIKDVGICNLYPYLKLTESDFDGAMAFFVTNPVRSLESQELLIPFHIALTSAMLPWHQQCKPGPNGGTILFNGLTIEVEFQKANDGEYRCLTRFPNLETESNLIRHHWRMTFEQLGISE